MFFCSLKNDDKLYKTIAESLKFTGELSHKEKWGFKGALMQIWKSLYMFGSI